MGLNKKMIKLLMPVGIHEPNPEENYYAWTSKRLKHFSVGALIRNSENRIAVQKLTRSSVDWVDEDGEKHSQEHPEKTFYFLPTSTHAPDISLEQTLSKAGEKIGWTVEPIKYLGIITSQFPIPQSNELVTKNTLWILCKPASEVERDAESRDADAEILWHTKDELMEIFAGQADQGSDRDQRNVLEILNTASTPF